MNRPFYQMKAPSKYKSKKVTVDGITFDSKAEHARWCELVLIERDGLISDLRRQVAFELQPKFRKNGKLYWAITYVADFVYVEDGKTIVEDSKGYQTADFKLKLKLFEYKYPDLTLLITTQRKKRATGRTTKNGQRTLL